MLASNQGASDLAACNVANAAHKWPDIELEERNLQL